MKQHRKNDKNNKIIMKTLTQTIKKQLQNIKQGFEQQYKHNEKL